MATFSLQALHDEIESDPQGIGYKEVGGAWKEDNVICDLINAKNYKIDNISIPMEEVRAATTYDGYNDLLADEQEWIRWMTPNGGNFRVTANMKLQLSGRSLASDGNAGSGNDNQSFWSVSESGELAPAMLALIEADGSRAEVLWGKNNTVSIGEVGHAANL